MFIISPKSNVFRMRVAGNFRRASRGGMRGVFWSWQAAQWAL